MLLSSIIILISPPVTASSWLETTDTDFADGNFLTGTGFQTELHGTGLAAYVQNTRDMANWTQMLPPSNPGPRRSFGFTNDSFGGKFVLFGGIDASSAARNDTWEYDYGSNSWARVCNDDSPACGPPRRFGSSMAFDNNSKVAVLFGGMAADFTTTLSDTWEYAVTTNAWVNRTTSTYPRVLGSHSMVYDDLAKQMILVGQGATAMEVWAYNPATHAWTQESPSGGPSLRSGFALGYNYQASHQRVVLFGGAYQLITYSDTWEYDPQADSWTLLNVPAHPSARAGAAMTYVFRSTVSGIVLWGGSSNTADLWRFAWQWIPPNPPIPVWFNVFTSISPDPPRRDHGLAYDPVHDHLIMYGGQTLGGTKLNDTWSLEYGYRLDGKYISSIFETFETATLWQSIFWNQTPASLPSSTLIRFQVNISNLCDADNMSSFFGPGRSSSVFYTTPGTALGYSGFKCIRYVAEMITYDPSVAPRLEDVSIIYAVPPLPPLVVSVSPTSAGNPMNAPFYLNFSKPMDTASVSVSVIPNVTRDTPWAWTDGDTRVKITHNTQAFSEGTRYDVCVWGADKAGNALGYPGNKYCWFFTVRAIPPKIVWTTPVIGTLGVSVVADVWIQFSEAMDTSTCWPYVTVDPAITFTQSWNSPLDTVLTLSHITPFQQFTVYTVTLPIGDPAQPCTDRAGNLLTIGDVPDPWYFRTEGLNPYIVMTSPSHRQPDVPVTVVINVTFSRPMDPENLSYSCIDLNTGLNCSIALTPTWPNSTTLLFTHTVNFGYCTPYQMQVWALDTSGRQLMPNPLVYNPWRFTTGGSGPNGCPPYIVFTRPADGDRDVPVDTPIEIVWFYSPWPPAGGMDASSFYFSVKDQYGNEMQGQFAVQWLGMGPDFVRLQRSIWPLNRCTNYTLTVLAARDKLGRSFIRGEAPNPIHFSTPWTQCQPLLIWAQPPDHANFVPVDEDIVLKFSMPMNTNSIDPVLIPTVTLFNYSWSENDTNVTISHAPFIPCQFYKAIVNAKAKDDSPLVPGPLDIPWYFSIVCVKGPYVTSTYPVNFQLGVPPTSRIFVNFSEPMDNSSIIFTLDPPAGTYTYQWADFDQTLIIYHSVPYADSTFYTATVWGRNKTGWGMVAGGAANPWRFRAAPAPPFIVSTDPMDGATGVPLGGPITVVFSEPMNQVTLVYDINPTPGITFTAFWPNAKTVRLSHAEPFGVCKRYQAWVLEAKDMDLNALVPGPVPNPWNFTTDCRIPLRGLQVHRAPPNDVLLTWTASPSAAYYKVFHSNDRLAPWSTWTEIANVTTTSVNVPGHLSDMRDHFYVVRGYGPGGEGTNSTMGALWHMQVSPNAGGSNTFRFSLPYNTIYKRASDIAAELGPGKTKLVAKWDSMRQQPISYYYLNGKWRGTDFFINAGDGLWIGIESMFDWAVNGTDRSSPLIFTYRLPPRTDYYFIGLPYTAGYATASEFVLAIEGGLGPGTDTKIDTVGKWVFSMQTSLVFKYGVTGWSGDDFTINPGDCLWVRITSRFIWSPELITPEIP